MKRKEFVRKLLKDGCVFLRSGANHDLYMNPPTVKSNLYQDMQKLTTIWQNISENI